MFSRLFKTPKSSLQLFRKNQAAMLPNDAESPQVPSETFSSLPIIRKVGLTFPNSSDHSHLQLSMAVLHQIDRDNATDRRKRKIFANRTCDLRTGGAYRGECRRKICGLSVNRQGYRAPSAHLPNASAKLWSGCGTTSARTNNNKITSPTPSAYATFRIRTAWNSASIFLTTASTRTCAQKLVTFNSSSSLRMAARNFYERSLSRATA